MRVDHCLRCHNSEVATNRFGLCRDCASKLTECDAAERYQDYLLRCRVDAWHNARSRRLLFRFLQTVAVICAITAIECAVWFLEPAFYRMKRHPYIADLFMATAILAPFAWFKARNMKRDFLDRSIPLDD